MDKKMQKGSIFIPTPKVGTTKSIFLIALWMWIPHTDTYTYSKEHEKINDQKIFIKKFLCTKNRSHYIRWLIDCYEL